jgi:VanZ family protein
MSSVKQSFDRNLMKPLRFAYFWLAGGVVLMILVLDLTLLPAAGRQSMWLNDKWAHFLTFFILMAWFSGVFRARAAPWVALGLLGFGIMIEIIQSRLPYRSAELADVISNAGGIVLGWGLAAAGFGRWTALLESWLPAKGS